jgi:GT2 family glycosyltransferase
MLEFDYAITFACYNQVDFTRKCVESMVKSGTALSRVVVVDNGSTDETKSYLESVPLGGRIFNRANLGCGVAWNQGVLALQAEWSIVMNNDLVVAPGWLENLIGAARRNNLKLVSPALIEGPLDYDFEAFAGDASVRMANALRLGTSHAVCLAVHESVWPQVGYFRADPRLLGFEDTLFFHEVEKAGIPHGITGASWIHHFGSITQKAMKQERGLSERQGLGPRGNKDLLNQSWLERKLRRFRRKREGRLWLKREIAQFGISMHGTRENGKFRWR